MSYESAPLELPVPPAPRTSSPQTPAARSTRSTTRMPASPRAAHTPNPSQDPTSQSPGLRLIRKVDARPVLFDRQWFNGHRASPCARLLCSDLWTARACLWTARACPRFLPPSLGSASRPATQCAAASPRAPKRRQAAAVQISRFVYSEIPDQFVRSGACGSLPNAIASNASRTSDALDNSNASVTVLASASARSSWPSSGYHSPRHFRRQIVTPLPARRTLAPAISSMAVAPTRDAASRYVPSGHSSHATPPHLSPQSAGSLQSGACPQSPVPFSVGSAVLSCLTFSRTHLGRRLRCVLPVESQIETNRTFLTSGSP